MRYQQTIAIHDRIEEVLRLIKTGRYSTPALAQEVGVSVPTISRIVATLRERGHDIQAERTQRGWRYVLLESAISDGKARFQVAAGATGDHGPKKQAAKG